MKKYLCYMLLSMQVCSCVANEQSKSTQFLVQQTTQNTNKSKNELKEDIGSDLKQALFTCTSLAAELGSIQKELATLQTRLLSNVESLVENKRCFRKARHNELAQTRKITANIQAQLRLHEQQVKKLRSTMDTNNCLREEKRT